MSTRLIIYEPPGSINCPPELVDGCWNTGLLEGCGDPQQFANRVTLEAYAYGRGETIRQVTTAAEGLALCKAWQQPVAPKPPTTFVVPTTPPPIGGAPGGGQVYSPPGLQPPIQTPGAPEPDTSSPGGPTILPGDTSTGRTFQMGEVYRLIIVSEPGRVDTGALYPGCSRSNPDACKPMQFASIEDAVAYSKANNEIPYLVNTIDEAWSIVDGSQAINPAQVISDGAGGGVGTIGMVAIGAMALFFLPKMLKKRGA